jgi:RNA polymerase sigma-70 factor (ECF subfamily)
LIQIAERDVTCVVNAVSAEIACPQTPWANSGTPARDIAPPRRAHGRAVSGSGQIDSRAERWADLIAVIARERDREAFAELFAYFAPRVKARLMKSGLGGPQAEDIAQETFISVWRKAELFRVEDGGAATWIFTIARNLRIDAIRRESRGGVSRVSDVEAQFAVDDSPLADMRMEEIQSEERVRKALSSLPNEQLRVVELSFFEEKAHPEIARLLDIPLGTVKSRLRLAMDRLRGFLGPNR